MNNNNDKIKVVSALLSYQVEQCKRHSEMKERIEELSLIELVDQRAAARAHKAVLNNTFYMLNEGFAFGLTKEEVIDIALNVPEFKAYVLSHNKYAYQTPHKFTPEMLNKLKV